MVAAPPPSHVIWEKVTVIQTLNVPEDLPVEPTTAEESIPHRIVTGTRLPIAVLIVSNNISNLLMYVQEKFNIIILNAINAL